MNKIYHLSNCSTCKRIIQNLPKREDVYLQDIKTEKISEDQLKEMERLAGGVEELFSKKARNYRLRGLHEQILSSEEIRALILEDYTFLKRPVSIINGKIFIGNSPTSVESLYRAFS